MGTLRTLLAIAVVLVHSYGFVMVGGRNAVQLFYMISGFLISYVLVERKVYKDTISFYINRYLRLYPIYFVVAALSLFTYVFDSIIGKDMAFFFKVYRDAPITANLLLVFSNATIFLQDWVMFAGVERNALVFTSDFSKGEVILFPALIVPQAWTLGVELAFYLVAPFILARRSVLLVLLALSIALRVYLVYIGLGQRDPWSYRFFPTELAFFLLGALSHQILLPYYRKVLQQRGQIEIYANIATYALIAIVLVYALILVAEAIKTAALFAVFLVLMPLTFMFQSKNRWDRWIGDLSYPIYICHMVVILIVAMVLGRVGITDKVIVSATAVVCSIGFSIALNRYVGGPVESLRDRFRANA